MKVRAFFVSICLLSSILIQAQFIEESKTVGVDHFCYDLNQLAAGVAFFDFNNDGFQDIVLSGTYNSSKIYENQGNNTFIDVTEILGLNEAGDFRATGVITGDFDNDGFTDVFFTSEPANRNYLFWNEKGKRFEEDGVNAGMDHSFYGTSCAVADYNLDGYLDLYVGNYTGEDVMYVNNGDRTFIPRTDLFFVDEGRVGSALSVAFSDIDMDGDMDLLLGNEYEQEPQEPNKLYINNYPDDSFTEMSASMNWDLRINTMGVATGDYDEDGDYDYYITDITDNYFFEKKEGLNLEEKAYDLGIANDESTSWGTAFFDYNNDTYLDLFVANGGIGVSQFEIDKDKLYKGSASGNFEDVSDHERVDNEYLGRGMSYGDYNNDGLLDLLVGVMWYDSAELQNTHTLLYRNKNEGSGNYIKINLQGTLSNRDGYGSQVTVTINDRELIREQTGGGTYMSHNSKVIHFGLGPNEKVDNLTIKWPGNNTTSNFENLDVNQTYTVVENEELFIVEYKRLLLLEGDSAFLQGEDRTEAGIYKDTIAALPPNEYRKIITTRLSFTDNEEDLEEENNQKELQYSVARRWNELLLKSIRKDYARPTVHARNLFHTSIAMYDLWAVFNNEAEPFFLGKSWRDYSCSFKGISQPENIVKAQEEAISYACYKLLSHRFKNSPGANSLLRDYKDLMVDLGYNPSFISTDYSSGSSAALGNYIAEQLIQFGQQDGSNEINDYHNKFYAPINEPLVVDTPGNTTLTAPNNWQPLTLSTFIDQSGNLIPGSTPDFLSPEWGQVAPFALKDEDAIIHTRDGFDYKIYNDPGKPVEILLDGTKGLDDPYKWGFAMVSIWSSHLDSDDGVLIDISPASIGNTDINDFPKTFDEYKAFYNLIEGGDIGQGHDINPITGAPYTPQFVPRGDYARVLAEFWADGPDSETPPGHWFTILNYVSDHPLTEKKFSGKGEVVNNLEWDVKTYLTLGGAMHDAAITAWGIKGYYDYIRPISAIRYMASKGQSSDTSLANYDPEGIPLVTGYIEIIQEGDPLAGANNENLNAIKLYAWKGSHFIDNPDTDVAGVDWILASDWVPYQRPSFVTPPFAGYVSGHSTFSRAASEVLTRLTGSNFFPGGIGTFDVDKNEFLVFEDGPSTNLILQWATYQDASDQTSLSRIWGGIHPPIDDIPGRLLGEDIGVNAFELSERYFYKDKDNDGFYSYEDIDDNNPNVPNGEEPNENIDHVFFPIPVSDVLNVNLDYKGTLTMQLFNVYGTMVVEKVIDIQNNNCEISLKDQSPGVYIVLFVNQNNEKIISKKVIKQ